MKQGTLKTKVQFPIRKKLGSTRSSQSLCTSETRGGGRNKQFDFTSFFFFFCLLHLFLHFTSNFTLQLTASLLCLFPNSGSTERNKHSGKFILSFLREAEETGQDRWRNCDSVEPKASADPSEGVLVEEHEWPLQKVMNCPELKQRGQSFGFSTVPIPDRPECRLSLGAKAQT